MMRLPKKEDKLFWNDLADFEKEKKMPYVTSVEKIGSEKTANFMFTRMIAKKFGESPDEILQMIKPMNPQDMEDIIDMFFDLESYDEFREWVRKRADKKSADR